MSHDWRDLPFDITATISKLLTFILDYHSFRGVCQSWRSAATFDNFDKSIPQMPWLMFMSADKKLVNNIDCEKSVKFVNLFNDNINRYFSTKTFPRYEFGTTLFSCSGWLLGITENSIQMELRHVTRGVRLELPGLDTFPAFANWYLYERHEDPKNFPFTTLYRPRCFIKKMAIISLPGSGNNDGSSLVVVVIWGERNQLGYSRPGDSCWAVMDPWEDSFSDVICHNGIVYGLDFRLRIVACEVCGENPNKLQTVFSFTDNGGEDPMCYLVVDPSSDKFIIVLPARINGFDYIEWFAYRECDLKLGREPKEITDIGNKAMFLGFNSSICLQLPDSSSNFIRPSGVYYTDSNVYGFLNTRFYDFNESECKTGMYMYEDMTKEECLPRHSSDATLAPLLWVLPSL